MFSMQILVYVFYDCSILCCTTGSNSYKRELFAPYTPKQNGIAERKNGTLTESAKSMLKAKDLPSDFWVEAASTVAFLVNRSPTKAVDEKTPKEAWPGKKPNVAQVKVFGSSCYTCVPNEEKKN